MRERLGELVFSADGRPYDWADVVLWAKGGGGWTNFENAVRLGLASARRADGDEEAKESESADDLVETAANEFRYEAGLLSAEEMESWLARSGLTVEEWMAFVERDVLRRRWAEVAPDTVAAFPVSDGDIEATLWCDGICSGALGRFARELAGAAAVHARLAGAREGHEQAIDGEAREGSAPSFDDLVGTLLGLAREASVEKLAHLARVDLALRRFSAQALTPRAIRDQISARYLDWVRLDCQVLSLPDEQMAREAALSVRADGLDLLEVAELVGATVHESRVCLDRAEPVVREALLSASKGDLVGPLAVDDEFRLLLVRDKIMPTEGDADIRRWAEDAVIARLLNREIDARVEWHHPVMETAR